jgi:acetate kinase
MQARLASNARSQASIRDRETLFLLYRTGVEGLGNEPHVRISDATGQQQENERLTANAAMNHEEALGVLLEWIEQHEDGLTLIAVGHRVVHGGRLFPLASQWKRCLAQAS